MFLLVLFIIYAIQNCHAPYLSIQILPPCSPGNQPSFVDRERNRNYRNKPFIVKKRMLSVVGSNCNYLMLQTVEDCSKCVHLDGLNAENTFHCWLYSV